MADAGLQAVLWDFGDTLVDQRWMLCAPEDVPQWSRVYPRVVEPLADAWMVGEISFAAIAERLAAELPMSRERVEQHARECCARIRFFPAVLAVVRRLSVPQAIVTVNPEEFSRDVVPALDLERYFQVIVTSWQEGTLDKSELCERARARLGGGIRREGAWLIDDIPANVAAWRALGGSAYLFRDEAQFERDLAGPLRPLRLACPSFPAPA